MHCVISIVDFDQLGSEIAAVIGHLFSFNCYPEDYRNRSILLYLQGMSSIAKAYHNQDD
jgi:hypothetical protein